MTEEAAAPADAETQASKTFALSAENMGRDLAQALIDELRNMPDHWPRLNKELQQGIIDRFKARVGAAIQSAQHMLTASKFTAVPATLTGVSRKGGIKSGLVIAKDAPGRHDLFDSEGKPVLVVIVDHAQWLQNMDELKAVGNQADLFDREENYDPTEDQGAFRRGDSPPSMVDSSEYWAEMRALIASGDDTAVSEGRIVVHELHQRLLEVRIPVSLAFIYERTTEERLEAAKWLEYKEHPHLPQPMRPAWLPEPKTDGDQPK